MPRTLDNHESTQAVNGRRSPPGRLVAAYGVYVPLAIVVVVLSRHQLNTDGVAYVRIAKYYAEGNFDLAITGYWAPLLSWLLIPWHLLHADPLLGAKVINALAGALFIWAVHRLAHALDLRGPIAWAVVIGSALLTLRWQERGIFPDTLFAALLTLYFMHSYRMSRLRGMRDAALAGLLAGVAYLAKYYALPFFVLHHSLAALLLARQRAGRWPDGRHLRCWAVGAGTFLVVAGPWITVLSLKYERPSFSTAAHIVHSYAYYDANSQAGTSQYWPAYQLMVPREGRITSWENPEEIERPWPQPPSLTSMAGMSARLRLLAVNGRDVVNQLFACDGLGLMYVTLLTTALVAHVSCRNTAHINLWRWRWCLITVAAYLSGLILIFAGTQRYYWPLQGLLLVLVGLGVSSVLAGADGISPRPLPWVWRAGLAAVILLACVTPCVKPARDLATGPGIHAAQIAQKLESLGVDGPLASNQWHESVSIAYHLDTPCTGVPFPGTTQDILQQLRDAGVQTFLLFDGKAWPPQAASLAAVAADLGPSSHRITRGDLTVRVYGLGSSESCTGQSTDSAARVPEVRMPSGRSEQRAATAVECLPGKRHGTSRE